MASLTFHPNEEADVKVDLTQASGAPTDIWDKVAGVTYTASHPDCFEVVDEDANPLDAVVRFTSPTPPGEDATLGVKLDGDPTELQNILALESDTFEVVNGPATAGRVTLTLRPVQP